MTMTGRFVVDLEAGLTTGAVSPYVAPPAAGPPAPETALNPPPRPELVALMAEAIAWYEGFYRAGEPTVAKRNHNPGNLRSWGSRPVKDGFAVFPSAAEGFRALRHQIRKNLDERGLSLREFFAGAGDYPGYAPASDSNDPEAYARFVRDWMADRGADVAVDRRGLL